MNKGVKIFVCILFLNVFLISFISAFSFSEFWNKITGKVSSTSSTLFCNDSDGGINYSVKGFLTSNVNWWNPSNSISDKCALEMEEGSGNYGYIDSCNGSSCYLLEYYCKSLTPESNYQNCPYGCQDGTCIPKEEQPSIQKKTNCQNKGGTICEDYQVCEGSIIEVNDTNRCCGGICKLPASFDWRNKHGENWMTSVKDQSSIGSCHEFGIVGTFESQINLYYNQHLDLDLSEQMYIDCGTGTSTITDFQEAKNKCLEANCWNSPFCKEMYTGLVDEACSPFAERDIYCNGLYQSTQEDKCCNTPYLCTNWKDRLWKNTGFHEVSIPPFFGNAGLCSFSNLTNNTDEIKKLLIEKGPIKSSIKYKYVTLNGVGDHTMILVGYHEPDIFIFKNSWGEKYGEEGYFVLKGSIDIFDIMGIPVGPFIPPVNKSYWPLGFTNKINCVDKDGDGFCNWGISENKPDTCPTLCKLEKDWDDSNPNIGALKIYNQTDNDTAPLIIPFCNDSDGGINYSVKGFLTSNTGGLNPLNPQYDTCIETEEGSENYGYIDSCNGSSCHLSEYYCNGFTPGINNQNCPYGCQDGACNKSEEEIIPICIPSCANDSEIACGQINEDGCGGKCKVGTKCNVDEKCQIIQPKCFSESKCLNNKPVGTCMLLCNKKQVRQKCVFNSECCSNQCITTKKFLFWPIERKCN